MNKTKTLKQRILLQAPGVITYMAPECILGIENANTQSDVYSFGVVLLEITCGRRPIVPQQDQRKVSLVQWVWDLYGLNALMEAVDERFIVCTP
jgi:serine/threonine protein kinase